MATLGLIALGGLVTSHGAGMAVPDWPTTYGYNMFLFPVSQWVGGIFYEHTHRLYASGVGLLTVILAVWLHLKAADRRLVRLGWLAVVLVMIQGLLGGLRVSLMKDQIGVLHASLAQAFLGLLVLIAVLTSQGWQRWRDFGPQISPKLAWWVGVATVMIFAQLILGAAMRHQHAGLAVPDFPLAYGRVWPPTDEAFIQRVNALRSDVRDFHPVTATHIYLHMAHRIFGIATAVVVVVAAGRLGRAAGADSIAMRLSVLWRGLILVQILLGASTVWFNKAADIATMHVVTGAACLGVAVWSCALARVAAFGRREASEGNSAGAMRSPGRNPVSVVTVT